MARASFSGRATYAVLLFSLVLSGCGDNGRAPDQTVQAGVPGQPRSFAQLFDSAVSAMGADGVGRIGFGGNGWEACLGQPWDIREGWARWEITDYDRVIDYNAKTSYQTAQRRAGLDPDKLGGCGAQPDAPAQNQQSSVSPDSGWEQQLQLWLTPLGFLDLAQENGAQVRDENGVETVVFNVEQDGITYTLEGRLSGDDLPEYVATRIDNPIFGDMVVEAEFTGYRDFDGFMFPTHVVQKQGGFATLDLTIDSVTPNTKASAEPPPRQGGGRFGGGGQQGEAPPPYQAIGEGIYVMNGSYQSVAMEFDDFSVVIDGLQNDDRAREIIRLTKEAIPDKPIEYVVNTHAHFDHANGLRQFVAEGTTIITNEINTAFYEQALGTPRTLNPAEGASNGMPVKVMGANDFFAIDDGSHRLELYKLNGSLHAHDMMIAYIPAIKTVVEADLLQPWINPIFGGGRDGPHPFLVYLADELDRLGLDYEQFVPVHRPGSPPLMTRADLMEAVGRE